MEFFNFFFLEINVFFFLTSHLDLGLKMRGMWAES